MRFSRSQLITAAVAIAGLLAVAGFLSEKGTRLFGGGGPSIEQREAARQANRTAREERRAAKEPRLFVGKTPIPLIVNGRETTSLLGQKLKDTLTAVTIASLHDIRTGWAVSDLLQAHGVQQAKTIVFTNRGGERWSADWSQITDSQRRLIVTYSRQGSLLLFSGPELPQGERPTPSQARTLAQSTPDLVSFPDVVKIEVTA